MAIFLVYREVHGFSYGLNWALASKGVVVKDNAFYNMTPLELKKRGTVEAGTLCLFNYEILKKKKFSFRLFMLDTC